MFRLILTASLILLAFEPAAAQVCRVSVTASNRNRSVTGPVHAECSLSVHTPPFGNWGVTSNFGHKEDGNQFQGWCHDTRVCDNNGNCTTECRDGWYEWNSCTDERRWAAPNCTLYNQNCNTQRSATGENVHGSKRTDVPVRCPVDTNGDGVSDTGGCGDAWMYRSGLNFMSLYELDPATGDDLIQTLYFPEVDLSLDCDAWGCRAARSAWMAPSFYDSPKTPAKISAELGIRVSASTFVDTSRACRAVAPPFDVVSGASFAPRIAPASLVSLFGRGLATQVANVSGTTLPVQLGGVRATITDSAGVARTMLLSYVSPEQVNAYVPAGTAVGDARIQVTRDDTVTARSAARLYTTAPALFSADGSGSGVASGAGTRVSATGQHSPVPIASCNSGVCTAVPIDLGAAGDRVFVSLYGTGIRNAASSVLITVGGLRAELTYAGPQGQYTGLDQVNFVLPQSLRGRGEVEVVLDQAGVRANTVTLAVR